MLASCKIPTGRGQAVTVKPKASSPCSGACGALPRLAGPRLRCGEVLSPVRRPTTACAAHKGAAVAAAAAATAAVPAGCPPCARPAPTQDPNVILHLLTAPFISALGGQDSWEYYLFSRFTHEVVAVAVLAVLAYWLLTKMAHGSTEAMEKHRDAAGATSGGEFLRLAADALTGPRAKLFFCVVLFVNVARNSLYIVDGFITKFNPKLPNDWLDDLIRLGVDCLAPLDDVLMKLSLVGSALFGCAVFLRWKDVLVAYGVKTYVEQLDKGQELVQSFVNPASNLLNWVIIVVSMLWLAVALGFNLKPLLAVGGASGIIIGLATQQVLGNFVSGLNIFLSRPFVAGEFISLVSQTLSSQTNISGRVIRVDPMRTLIATEDGATVTVPNQIIAVSIVVNRSRSPHWTVSSASPLLANIRELRWRMKLPHSALERIEELEAKIDAALTAALPNAQVRYSPPDLHLVKFNEGGAEIAAKVNLVWRLREGGAAKDVVEKQQTQEVLVQTALLALQKVVRSCDGAFVTV
ncbi:hypothetical protein HYH02_009828 [Chlamydomonas schloesseri]|uniref:Mechanosensitive ion channel MscS domain-containing protein n=1 Tax=Chlamydomonas schloesseri TaxID=2026947 RepID=A0A835TDE9_9CHLO|nr:hypothetical protein HYH02_009828 [Chlamydomonas schloesseri]|eukprot:KAG2442036.1 hypothetical protein HYH02_009828 [Chlamydomonas schloesseri]